MSLAASAYADLSRIRRETPLVLNVTNTVVTNFTANALLALGASPAMTHAPADAAELAAVARAVVVNMGTPGEAELASMLAAVTAAAKAGVPVVFDPVAVGATAWRRRVAAQVLEAGPVRVIRGNASEVLALAGENARSRGVDSLNGSSEAGQAAASLARRYACVVCASGEVDVISDGKQTFLLAGGHPLMPRVTGMGCAASALVGAFVGANADVLAATTHAMAIMAAAGSVAAVGAAGPGSLQIRFLDALFALTQADLETGARLVS
jgi:hydroxyethylthiazole kinase